MAARRGKSTTTTETSDTTTDEATAPTSDTTTETSDTTTDEATAPTSDTTTDEATAPTTDTPQENTVTETAAETSTETPATEAPAAEAPIDLEPFKAAVATATSEADVTTGEVSVDHLNGVTEAYRNLDGIKAKNLAKALVNDLMKEAMNSGNLAGARAALNLSEKALVAAAGGSSTNKAPADPTENFVQRVATLNLAYNLATTGEIPENVAGDWAEKASALVSEGTEQAVAYRAWTEADAETRGDEPEVSTVIRNAVKLATGKAAKAGVSRGGGSFTGERKDTGAHIVNAFEDKEVGTFLTIAQIRTTKSEEYGDAQPSAGAISARLFPKSGNSTMEKFGIQPDTQDGKKGAVKVEIAE